MRISTIQAFNNGVQGLQRNYANATRTQEQINTRNRILTPADDPVASVRLLQLEQQQNVLSQYKGNLTAAQSSLTQEESTLNSVNTLLQRVRELAVQAGNGALSQTDRQAIATELNEREGELLGLSNTRNARGEYLFSGFQGKTPTFVADGKGGYSYMGDEGQRTLQIGSSLQVPISDNGKQIFQNVIDAGRLEATSFTSPVGSTLSISAPLVQSEVAFSGPPAFPVAGIGIRFTSATAYEIYDLGSTATPPPALAPPGVIDSDPTSQDALVFAGVLVKFKGIPVGGEVIEIKPKTDPASGQPKQKQGILDTIAQLRMTLENPASSSQVSDAVALAITNLDHGMTTVDSARGAIGARLNVIESAQTDNEDVSLINKSVQADLRELDYAEALSRLSFQTIILEAAQQSYVKISSLNLFNQLR